jgi:uncharacterized RDD family membrane protein YckC
MSTDAADARYETDAPSLVIISGNDSGRRIPVPSTGIVLGREGKLASLFRDDPLVSRGHAHVYLAEDRSVQVADLNSTNGTFVNGKAIRSLTRLTDRDVLRIGSIDMRLDSPRADNRPADETVMLPAAHVSWPDTRPGRRGPPETPRYEDGRWAFPSTGAWPDAQAKAHAGLGEPVPGSATSYPPPGMHASWPDPLTERLARPAERRYEDDRREFPSAGARPDAQQRAHDDVTQPVPASAAAAPPDAPEPAPADTTEAVWFAPHPLRLLAFMIDLSLVAAATGAVAVVTGSLVVYAVVLLMAWVIYQTGAVWLTGGRTIGKAACSLSIRHIDGSAPRQDRDGLAWAFGRASLGYLVIDMGGLGILVGLRNPRRRCLHDYAFASEVVLHPDTGDPLHPRGRLERLRQRLQQFTEDRENAWEAKKKNYAFVATLWKWLVRITEISLAGLLFARDRWHALVQRLAADAHPTTSAPAAKALTAGKITTLVATTTVATGTAVAVAVATATYLAAPIIGDWGGLRITRVGVQSYHATGTVDAVSPRNGCTFPKGQEDARISGHGQHYTGYSLWAFGHDGQDCRFKWEPSTFDLIGTNILRICTTDPALRNDPERCIYGHRSAGG